MKKQLCEFIYWTALLSTCLLIIVAAVFSLRMFDLDQPLMTSTDAAVIPEKPESVQQLFGLLKQTEDLSGVLLPLGPADGRLPGTPELWTELMKANGVDKVSTETNGFDGLQAVEKVTDFSRAAVSELFLSGDPLRVFRRGHFLYLLNETQKVRIIDCREPDQPTLSGFLPYSKIKHMEMRGSIAYLLLERRGSSAGRMVVVDLESPGQQRELAKLDLPEGAFSFFFVDSKLLVYSVAKGYVGENRIYVYDLNDSFQLQLLGHIEDFNLGLRTLQYDQYLLVPGSYNGLDVYDFSDPLKPEQVATLDSPYVRSLARYGDLVLATGSGGHLSVFDFSDPLRPAVRTDFAAGKYLAYLLAYDNYTYFFTFDGYMQVFNLPFGTSETNMPPSVASDGPLVSLSPEAGFTLLEKTSVSLPAAVAAALPLRGGSAILDQLVWQDSLVVLGADGRVRFFRLDEDRSLSLRQELQLLTPRRWLAAGRDHLYVGGGKGVGIITQNYDGEFSVATEINVSENETWDGLVVQDVLLLAAGKEGVLAFSLQRPDSPLLTSSWSPPRYLSSQVEVSCLTAVDDARVLFSGGAAGVFSGHVDSDKKFTVDGSFRFTSPVNTVAVHHGVALVATGEDVSFLDVRASASLQNLGKISFPHVQRIAVAEPDLWAGYVEGSGWSIFPLPRFVLPAQLEYFMDGRADSRFDKDHFHYRLHLFTEHEVRTVPGILTLPDHFADRANGGRPYVN